MVVKTRRVVVFVLLMSLLIFSFPYSAGAIGEDYELHSLYNTWNVGSTQKFGNYTYRLDRKIYPKFADLVQGELFDQLPLEVKLFWGSSSTADYRRGLVISFSEDGDYVFFTAMRTTATPLRMFLGQGQMTSPYQTFHILARFNPAGGSGGYFYRQTFAYSTSVVKVFSADEFLGSSTPLSTDREAFDTGSLSVGVYIDDGEGGEEQIRGRLPHLYFVHCNGAPYPDLVGDANNPYYELLLPLEGDILYPNSPARSWEYLRQFGEDAVPDWQSFQHFVSIFWPEFRQDENYLITSKMYYVIRRLPSGKYEVDLLGVQAGDPELPSISSVSLRYKSPKLFGIFGGYYQGYWESPRTPFVSYVSVLRPGQSFRMFRQGPGFMTDYKINKNHDIVAFGRFYPEENEETDPPPPIVKEPVGGVPPAYDPDYQPDFESALEETFWGRLFIPKRFSDLPLSSEFEFLTGPIVRFTERVATLSDFEEREGFPEGIVLWGVDFAPTIDRFFGSEVSIPLIGQSLSLYEISRILTGINLSVFMLITAWRTALSFFSGGDED